MARFCWWILLFDWSLLVYAGKDKCVKKRTVAVTDPWGLRSLEDWINLGPLVLKKSCEAANLSSVGSLLTLAKRLYHFYHGMGTAEQGMRVFNLCSLSIMTLGEVPPSAVPLVDAMSAFNRSDFDSSFNFF